MVRVTYDCETSRPAVSHHRLHMYHLQESTRRWEKVLSLGRVCLATISCLTGEWQAAGEHQRHCSLQTGSPIRWQKCLHQQNAKEMLDRANGLLSAGGLWEEPGSIKITASQALELLWLFESCPLGAFLSLGFLSLGPFQVL